MVVWGESPRQDTLLSSENSGALDFVEEHALSDEFVDGILPFFIRSVFWRF
jgi:hypothetical protein